MARSITESLSDPAFQFVKQGLNEQKPEAILVAEDSRNPNEVTARPSTPKVRRTARRRRESASQPAEAADSDHRVPLSTRIRASLVAELKMTGLRRQLTGASPNTIQGILEQAAEEWLRRHAPKEDEAIM